MNFIDFERVLFPSQVLLISYKTTVELETKEGATSVEGSGELMLVAKQAAKGRVEIEIKNFGLISSGNKIGVASTGTISLMGHKGHGFASLEDNNIISLKATMPAALLYERLVQEIKPEKTDYDEIMTPPEYFDGVLNCNFMLKGKGNNTKINLENSEAIFTFRSGGLGLIRSIKFTLEKAEVTQRYKNNDQIDANNECPTGHSIFKKRLQCQPVVFRSSNSDTNPTGSSSVLQFSEANSIWGKCCVEFQVLPAEIITNATVKISSDLDLIFNSFPLSNPNVIEVYFVDNDLAFYGGGATQNGGSGLAKVVITDSNSGNPHLLAHELGHVLGGKHPGVVPMAPRWEGDSGTVLASSSSAAIPNPDKNTYHNCISVSNPAIQTLPDLLCCLTHDKADHYIRDFPEDMGTEPNPGYTGRNFYSMSNIWNRRSNTAGITNSDGTPDHQQPARFQTDGITPFVNYMFAKVEAINNLKQRNTEVRFYIKHPGSGGGSANIQPLGTVAVSDSLSPSSLDTVSIPWEVPAGTPNHSCVFAVVASPAEPETIVSSLNFQEVETIVREENDWAQRNLNLVQTLQSNDSEGNRAWSQSAFLYYPPEKSLKRAKLSFQYSTKRSKDLENIKLDILGLGEHELESGIKGELDLGKLIKPGQIIPYSLFVELPTNASIEDRYETDIIPLINGEAIAGYTFAFSPTYPVYATAQAIDEALAASYDAIAFLDIASAEKLLEIHRIAAKNQPVSTKGLEIIAQQSREILNLIAKEAEKKQSKHLKSVGFLETLEKLNGSDNPVDLISTYRLCIGRLHIASYIGSIT